MKNITSQVEAEKSIMEIEKILSQFGATNIHKAVKDGRFASLSFCLDIEGRLIPFRMPANLDHLEAYLLDKQPYTSRRQKTEAQYRSDIHEQAYKTGCILRCP